MLRHRRKESKPQHLCRLKCHRSVVRKKRSLLIWCLLLLGSVGCSITPARDHPCLPSTECFVQEQTRNIDVTPRPVVGAIRWDAWYGGKDAVGLAVEKSLSPKRWHYRLPFF